VIISVWRVVKSRYSAASLTGEGARLYGGRWTSPGQPVAYCAQHLSLAILEILVHTESKDMLKSYVKVKLEIQSSQIEILDESKLPTTWKMPFPGPELQRIGDRWLASQSSLVLGIPSVIVPEEINYLINPLHPEFQLSNNAILEPLALDSRLVTK